MENFIDNIFIDDDESLHILFERYYRMLLRFAGYYISEINTRKDIVQDIFLSLAENRIDFKSESHLKAYLYVAVKNRCLQYLRNHKTHREHGHAYLKELDNDDYFSDKVVEHEVINKLIDEINNLPDSYRNVYLLSLEGKKNQEIACQLGITVETVKSYKKKGKKILIQRLKTMKVYILLL